jgi:hypothetical protein
MICVLGRLHRSLSERGRSSWQERSVDPPWWACSHGGNQDIVGEYRVWTAAESPREIAEHASRVRERQHHVDAEIIDFLGPDPDAEQFAGRMANERPRTTEQTLALVRGTDSQTKGLHGPRPCPRPEVGEWT